MIRLDPRCRECPSGGVERLGEMSRGMTPTVTREKESFLSDIEQSKRRRTGSSDLLERLRGEAESQFEALAFPTTRNEDWKYTNVAPLLRIPFRQELELNPNRLTREDLAPIIFGEASANRLVFINGRFASELSSLDSLPAGVIVGSLAKLSTRETYTISEYLGTQAAYRDDAFTALNTALIGEAACIYLPQGVAVESPIQILYLASPSPPNSASHPRTLLVVAQGALATVVESYASLDESVYLTNAVTEVVVAECARLDHYRLQEESDNAFHIGATSVVQESASFYSSAAISLGARLSRHNLELSLGGQRSECIVNGLYVVAEGQHCDNHTSIDHREPNCVSHQLYKGILDGNGRAVFNGKILVREGAIHTDARQLNKNLLLSNGATVNTKPQLEILADDVKCAHGATVGQLEDEELFYLASRGLDPERARALLTYGFAEDVISKIRLESVRGQLDRIVLDKLHQSLEVQ